MEKEFIEKIIPIILKHDLLVISDEIYAELTYGQKHCSIASFEQLKDRVVLISGFSKAFAMTGWRVGYVCAPKEIKEGLLKIHQYGAICAPIFSQYAALSGLVQGRKDGYASVELMRSEYDKRRKFMIKSFNDMGLTCFEPKGAFYVFPSVESTGMTGEEFATALLNEKGVAVVPGDAFGEFGKYYVRCSYAYSMKNLVKAMEKIAEFVKNLK
jgi:aminotransferase